MVAVASTGRSSGRITRMKVRTGPAPSTRAASSSSCGIVRTKPVTKKITVDRYMPMYTPIMPSGVPARPSWRSRSTIVTTAGGSTIPEMPSA
jgi:hypothetical protein